MGEALKYVCSKCRKDIVVGPEVRFVGQPMCDACVEVLRETRRLVNLEAFDKSPRFIQDLSMRIVRGYRDVDRHHYLTYETAMAEMDLGPHGVGADGIFMNAQTSAVLCQVGHIAARFSDPLAALADLQHTIGSLAFQKRVMAEHRDLYSEGKKG